MLKEYAWRGNTWQFDDATVPSDAVEIDPITRKPVARKEARPANKAAKPADKSAKAPARATSRASRGAKKE